MTDLAATETNAGVDRSEGAVGRVYFPELDGLRLLLIQQGEKRVAGISEGGKAK